MQAFLCQRRAFDICVGFYLLGQLDALLASDRGQVLLLKRLYCVGVIAQVDLGAFGGGGNMVMRDREWVSLVQSRRRLVDLPQSTMGVSGQWCRISGIHLLVTLVNVLGLMTLKQTRNTFVWG